ncbi:LolA family protein [Stagnihabitans tardus]|uniref:Outer membrane lipoprotein carrier protein LolA n=1 Tax=Stagnihabitans tardus TaxID=2699202 RepID=A0AAE5BX40_9RHOB|nr:outer membrane lipoprotein carrier protein LolA [Stagnihabitans tardus]NBZ89539.1 outer membrane lipoprotein carrier protein LolA [Stagnihabitans tardus]
MNLIAFLAPLAFAPLLLAAPLRAAEVPLATLSAYLQGLVTAEAPFEQVNADGTTSSGKIILKRPGFARFEYAKPDRTLVLASQGIVAVFDGKTNSAPQTYQLQQTPLNLILGRNIDLVNSRMVVDHTEFQGDTHVLAQDPAHADLGSIELIFGDSPVRLKGWITTDEAGNQTSLTLGTLKTGESYSSNLFSIDREKAQRGID